MALVNSASASLVQRLALFDLVEQSSVAGLEELVQAVLEKAEPSSLRSSRKPFVNGKQRCTHQRWTAGCIGPA